jgi:hypothetical protein
MLHAWNRSTPGQQLAPLRLAPLLDVVRIIHGATPVTGNRRINHRHRTV